MRKITQQLIDALLRIIQSFYPNIIDVSILPPDTYVQRIVRSRACTADQNELWICELKSHRPEEGHLFIANYENNMQLAFYKSVIEVEDYRKNMKFIKDLAG